MKTKKTINQEEIATVGKNDIYNLYNSLILFIPLRLEKEKYRGNDECIAGSSYLPFFVNEINNMNRFSFAKNVEYAYRNNVYRYYLYEKGREQLDKKQEIDIKKYIENIELKLNDNSKKESKRILFNKIIKSVDFSIYDDSKEENTGFIRISILISSKEENNNEFEIRKEFKESYLYFLNGYKDFVSNEKSSNENSVFELLNYLNVEMDKHPFKCNDIRYKLRVHFINNHIERIYYTFNAHFDSRIDNDKNSCTLIKKAKEKLTNMSNFETSWYEDPLYRKEYTNNLKTFYDGFGAIIAIGDYGVGRIEVGTNKEENLFNDYSFAKLFEYTLHQKFYSNSINERSNKYYDNFFFSRIFNTLFGNTVYFDLKDELIRYIDIFNPTHVCDGAAQNVYEELRSRFKINEIMDDALNSLKVLEVKENKINAKWIRIVSIIASCIVFPVTVYTFQSKIIEYEIETISYLCWSIIGFFVWFLYGRNK